MRKRYDEGEITQKVHSRKLEEDKAEILESALGNGYQKTLEKGYMKELSAFLQKGEKANRFALVAPSLFVARQAYLTLLWALEERGRGAVSDGYSYSTPYKASFGAMQLDCGEVLALDCKVRKKEEQEEFLAKAFGPQDTFGEITNPNATFSGNKLSEAENLLLECGVVRNADKLANAVLLQRNPNVAVYLQPGGSSEYVLKRLVFEGDYRVIILGCPSIKDYVKYAQDYITCHGFCLDEDVDLQEMICSLQGYRGSLLTEQDIYRHLSRVFHRSLGREEKVLSKECLKLNYYGLGENSRQQLNKVIGLEPVKQTFERFLASERVLSEQGMKPYRNLIFAGPPGSGKSMMARCLAKCMEEQGLSNGRFVDVCRADIIGKYVGHTAYKVREAFQKADGGVMFVDEAEFLLGGDVFVKEAVIEFVRFMELNPQTMIIFAGYPKEMKELKSCDSGFASRIKKVISFSGYETPELYEIFCCMAEKYGFTVEKECEKSVGSYVEKLRRQKDFAYARDVRKLLEASIEEFGMEADKAEEHQLKSELLERAARWLLAEEYPAVTFGFGDA